MSSWYWPGTRSKLCPWDWWGWWWSWLWAGETPPSEQPPQSQSSWHSSQSSSLNWCWRAEGRTPYTWTPKRKKQKNKTQTACHKQLSVDPVAVALLDKRSSSVLSVGEQPCAAACGTKKKKSNSNTTATSQSENLQKSCAKSISCCTLYTARHKAGYFIIFANSKLNFDKFTIT